MLKSKSAGTMGFVGAALAMLLTAGLALLLLSSAVAQAQDDPPPNEAPTVSGVFSDAFDVTMPAAEEQQQATPSGPEPRNVQIVPGDGVVTVTWEASPFYYKERLIGAERIKHALRWWVGSGWANPVGEKGFGPNDGIHVESGVTSYTITGLTNGVAVEANVRAFFGSNYQEGAMNKGESSTSSRWVSSGVATPTEPNNAPTVESTISDATIANESGTHQVSHSGVFTDADGDDLTVTATSSDEKVATVSVSADHSTLTVSAKKRGTATVTITAEDGNGGSVEDSFTVTVKAAPVVASAIADVSELAVDATQKVSMSGVFSDADGDALTVTASSSDEKVATVTVAADYSSLTLTGKAAGTATVTVTAEDSDGNSVSDAFGLTVTAEQKKKANNAPTVSAAIGDATIMHESGTHEASLSGVFTDADGDALKITASSSDEKVATVSVSTDYSSLTVTAKSRGTATITVTAADGKGGSVEDSFTVTVKAAPTVASAIADVSELAANATQKTSLSGVFTDADDDSLTVTASSSDEKVATVSVDADQSGLTLTGKTAGTATITVTAQDSDGNSVSDAFDLTVTAEQEKKVNNAPMVSAAIGDATILHASGAHEASLSGVFTDADGDELKITATSSEEKVATVSVSTDQAALTVSAKKRGTATVTVTASDGNGGSVEDSFTVTVKAAPVVASAIADVSELEIDATQKISLSGVFSDADGDSLTVTASSSKDAVATVSVAADYSDLTLTGKASGTATITVSAQDSDGNSTSDAFDVTVVKANNAPTVASAIDDATIVSESDTSEVSLSGVFTDADGDDLTINASSSDEKVATVSVSADYSSLTVTAKARGTATITVTAADGKGGSVEDSFTVTVKAAPVVASAIADVSELEVDETHKISLSGVFSDADGDSLTVTAGSSKDAVATVAVATDQSDLTLTGKAEGTATITVTAEDSDGNSTSDAFDVTVTLPVQAQQTVSTDATLSGLTLTKYSGPNDATPEVALRPAFASGTLEYAASAPAFTAHVRVKATASDSGATVTVDGQAVNSGAFSQSIQLVDNRPKRITVAVTAADGITKQVYTVSATLNPRADLRALSVSPGQLHPRVFVTSDKTYQTWTRYGVKQLQVTATGRHGGETITVNGQEVSSGQASPAIDLDVGKNVIEVVATAPDDYTKTTYTITAVRLTQAQSADASLDGIAVYRATSFQPDVGNEVGYTGTALTLQPAVTGSVREYGAKLPEADGSYVAVTVTTKAPNVKSIVIRGPVSPLESRVPKDKVESGEASGPWYLVVGYSLVTIEVTSLDGENTETYRLILKRGRVDDPKGLRLTPGDKSLTLHWDANSGTTAPTHYQTRWRKAGETAWLNPATFSGLRTSYSFGAPYATAADGGGLSPAGTGSSTVSGLENGVEYEVHARAARITIGNYNFEVMIWPTSDWHSVSGTAGEPKTVLTVTPSNPTREYGGTDDLSYTVSGLATGDTAAAVVTGTLSRASGDDAGDYAIGMGTLAIASAHEQKYELPSSPAITTYRITPRAVTSVSGVTVESRADDGSTDANFDTGSADGTGVLASELADFRAGGLVVSGAFPAATPGTHDVAVTYSLQDHGSFKAANYSLSATAATLQGRITGVSLPGPVTGLKLTATHDSVTVSWGAPESGDAPLGYIVHIKRKGGVYQATRRPGADRTTVTFRELSGGSTYEVWVRAQNKAGKGERVRGSIALPVGLPGPVVGLAITATEDTANSVTVSWSAPQTGGAPDGYIAHLRPEGGESGSGRTKKPNANKMLAIFGNIEATKTYEVWVRAQNAAGKGERVHASVTLLTVTPNSTTREYGDADDLGYAVGGLLDGDAAAAVVTGALSRAPGEDVGDYAIGMGTLAVAPDYSDKYIVPRSPSITTYRITPRPITGVSGVTVESREADGTTTASFDTSAAEGVGVITAELADFRAGGLQVSGAFPTATPGAHDVAVTYSLQDHVSFKAHNYSLSTTTATLQGQITAASNELACVPTGFKDTTDDPDLINIYTLEDLNSMYYLGDMKGYELMADLDFDTNGNGKADAGDAYWNGGNGFSAGSLNGIIFDGNGHTIRNLYINGDGAFGGLFSRTDRGSEIRNLRLEDVNVTGGHIVGGLVGSNAGKIIDVYATGTVNGNDNVGGLVGWATSSSLIIASAFEGDVTSVREAGGLVGTSSGGIIAGCSSGSVTNTKASYDAVAGGLTSTSEQPGYVIASYSSSHVTVASGTLYAGGLIGVSTGPTTASYAIGRVSGGSDPGGLWSSVGALIGSSSDTSDSYWNKDSNPTFHTTVGWVFTDQWRAFGKTTRQLQSPTGYTGIYAKWNVDLNGDGSLDDPWNFGTSGEYPTLKYSGLDNNPTVVGRPGGTDYDTDDDGLIEISSLAQLNAIRWDIDGDGGPNRVGYRPKYGAAFPDPATTMGCPSSGCIGYELMQNLDFDTNDSDSADAGDAYWNGGSGWTPVQDQGLAFRAVFEGNGHTISNLYINDATGDAHVGLFRAVVYPGVVRNVGLLSASVTASLGNAAAGALAGMNEGEISGAYMTGSVEGSHAAAGLVGHNQKDGKITASYAAGSVSGSGRDVGGLVGSNRGEITASYAAVSVAGGDGVLRSESEPGGENVGGLVGYNDSPGVITASYAVGPVSGGGANIGGLVGFNRSQGSASYWDTETSGQASSAAGVGKTTAELQEPTGYAGIYADWNVDVDGDGNADDPWDFGSSCQYPTLKYGSLNPDDQRTTCTPSGTIDYDTDDDGLIEVSNLAQLNAIRWDLDGDGSTGDAGYAIAFPNPAPGMGCPTSGCKGYELTADLDFDTNGNGKADAGDAYWNGGAGWTPIGFGTLPTPQFTAIFDGNGHTISNLRIKPRNTVETGPGPEVLRIDGGYMGFFTHTGSNAVIRNVGLESVDVSPYPSSLLSVGGLVATNNGTVSSSYVTGVVSNRSQYIGGLVGDNNGKVVASYSNASVSGGDFVGGLVGRSWNGKVIASYSTASVNGGYFVGGLVGWSYGTIVASYSLGSVPARTHRIGGLTGHGPSSRVSDSYWDTETSGQASSAAGIGKTTAELQELTGYAGIYADWNVDVDGDGNADDPWDFGNACQYPTLNYGSLNPDDQRKPCTLANQAATAPRVNIIGTYDPEAVGYDDAAVHSMSLPQGVTMAPDFQSDNHSYRLTVPADMEKLTLSGDFNLRIERSESESFAILVVGDLTIYEGLSSPAKYRDDFELSEAMIIANSDIGGRGTHTIALAPNATTVIEVGVYKTRIGHLYDLSSRVAGWADRKAVYTLTVTRGDPGSDDGSAIADISGLKASSTRDISLPEVFGDADGDALTVTAVSSDTEVATVSVASDGSKLTVTGVAEGTATIMVIARDSDDSALVSAYVSDSFEVGVWERAQIDIVATYDSTAEGYDDAAVNSMSLSQGITLHPEFQSDHYNYRLTVPADMDRLTLVGSFDPMMKDYWSESEAFAILLAGDLATFEVRLWSHRAIDTRERIMGLANSNRISDLRTGRRTFALPPDSTTVIEIGMYKTRVGHRWDLYYRPSGWSDRKTVYTLTVTRGNPGADDSGGTAQPAPTVVLPIADVSGLQVGDTRDIPLSGVFSDALTIVAKSWSTSVATVSVSADYSTLTITAKSPGRANVTYAADNGRGGKNLGKSYVYDVFTVTVTAAPTVASPIADVSGPFAGSARDISLAGVFSDADGDALTVSATSSNTAVATMSVSADYSTLTITAKSRGTVTVTVTADDGRGGTVSDTFTVTITAAPTVASPITDVSNLFAGDVRDISLAGVFSDADGDALTITATSSDPKVAAVYVAADGSKIAVAGVAEGTATVTATANDGTGGTATDEFTVTVKAAEDPPGPEPWNIQVVPGDGTLTVTWNISSRGGYEDTEIWHVLRWSQEFGKWGNPRDPRAVGKNDGLSVDPGVTTYTITGLENGVGTGVFIRSMVGHRNNMSERAGDSSKWVRVKGLHTTPVAPSQ